MYQISIAKYTELGTRERNEDYMLSSMLGTNILLALADGLGGHGKGDEASACACQSALGYLQKNLPVTTESFQPAFDYAQAKILERQVELHAANQMRTTLNLLCLDERMAYWGHVGDSRTYYFEGDRMVRRTFDHSVPQMLAAMGDIPEKKIRFHEDRNRLLRVLGVEDHRPECEVEKPIALNGDQSFLMCSDGFWELISEEQMELCLSESDTPQIWLDNMLELLHRNVNDKPMDNTTAIAVFIRKGESE